MGTFICEKCGKIDNTACSNNYWHAIGNKHLKSVGMEIDIDYKPEFGYFEDHVCCSDCCEGIVYVDNSGVIKKNSIDIKDKKHWSEYGKEVLLKLEAMKDGSVENATEYFKSIGVL